MPEGVIQRADQYQADKYNKGVLTPDKSAAMVASPGIYNHALLSMYNDKYSSSFEDFDKFKSAYQSQYGDPFKKKEPSATPSPTKKVQSFQPSEQRSTTPLNEALKDAASQPQELPSENYVTPSEGTQVATFQTGGDRKQISVEDAQKPLSLDAKQQEADARLSDQNSKGLIANATPEQKKHLEISKAVQAGVANTENYKQPAESTATKTAPLTAQEAGGYAQPYSALENAIDYTKIAARQITGVVPGMIDVINIALEYADEKVSGNPGAYTQEERDASFKNATLAEKALAYVSGERATASYNEFEKNYLTGSKANEESEAGAYASAVGQIIPMFLTGGASSGVKATQLAFKGASALNKAKFLVNGAGKLIVETSKSPSTYIAAQQIFNDTFQDAYQATGDSDKAMLAAGVNTAASAGLEALPFLNFTKRLDNMTGGTVKKVLISGAVGGGAELVTEVAQTFTDNLVASNIYDETRKLTDGLAQSGEIGGVVGFAISAVMASLHIRLKNSTDPYERQEIQKSIDEIAPKVTEVKKQENILANAVENQAVVQKNVEVQKALSDDNISTATIVEASQLRAEMPNYEEVKHKTVGLENKINLLMVEKNGLYDKVDGSGNINEQTKTADARSKAIDKEIRVISNQIADVYAQPSKEIVDQETASEVGDTVPEDKTSKGSSVDTNVSGIPEAAIVQDTQENIIENGKGKETVDTTNQGSETSSIKAVAPKVEEQKTKIAGRGKTPLDKRNVNNPDILSALSHDVSDVEDLALQSFVRGEITPTKGVYDELYANSNGDKKSAIGIIRTPEKGGKTLDQMAHKLWETQPNTNQYSDTDFKNAIINTIKTNSSKLSAAIKLNDKFNVPIEVDGKRVNSSGEQLHETPHGWMTQGSIDDLVAAEEFKKDVSADDYDEVMQEYDNLSDEEFNKLFAESQSEQKKTIADKSETIKEGKEKASTAKESQIEKDAIDLNQGEFEAKHPEEDYETTRQYATKDTEAAMEANKKSENPENFVMYANGLNIPFTMGNIPAIVKARWIKTFQKGAGIPYQFVYERSVKRKSTIDRRTQELNQMVKDIHKNIVKKINDDIDQKIKENPKDKSTLNLTRPKHNVIPEDIALELNDRFAGRKTSNLISEDIMLEIDKARNSVISLQKEMVAMDLLDTDIHLGTNEKGEYYVNRTYRKFDDKGWKDKIPQKVMNKAILVLRDLYNSRDTNVESLADKKDNLIKSAEQKIEDRITNLQEKKILVANTVGKIDKKIRVNSKNASIPTQDIDALKQRKETLLTKLAKLESDTKKNNQKTEFYIKKAKKDLENFLRDNKGNTEIDIDGHIEKDIQRFITSDPDAYSGNVSAESAKVVSSIFKSKSEFLNDHKALREVMGEVNDPFINILNHSQPF